MVYNPGTGCVMMSRDIVLLEPKETRKQEKELAIIQEKSSGPTRKKNEAIYVSDEDGNKNMQESDHEEENEDIPYLIPQEEHNTSNTEESETKEEEQDHSCVFRIPTQSVLVRSGKRRNMPQRKSPRLSQVSYNSTRTTRNSRERVSRDTTELTKDSGTGMSGKVSRAMKNLEASYNPDTS